MSGRTEPKPTEAGRADAGDRLHHQITECQKAVYAALQIVKERRGHSISSYPMFPFIGDKIQRTLEAALDDLRSARSQVAETAYESHRTVRLGADLAGEADRD